MTCAKRIQPQRGQQFSVQAIYDLCKEHLAVETNNVPFRLYGICAKRIQPQSYQQRFIQTIYNLCKNILSIGMPTMFIQAIYDLCKENLAIERPTYTNLNRLIAQENITVLIILMGYKCIKTKNCIRRVVIVRMCTPFKRDKFTAKIGQKPKACSSPRHHTLRHPCKFLIFAIFYHVQFFLSPKIYFSFVFTIKNRVDILPHQV